jgi:hypothetical protein
MLAAADNPINSLYLAGILARATKIIQIILAEESLLSSPQMVSTHNRYGLHNEDLVSGHPHTGGCISTEFGIMDVRLNTLFVEVLTEVRGNVGN